jgi:heterodisulfide reductase subunit C
VAKALDLYDKEEFYRCLQCAICTGSCPAAQVVDGFNPREIILRYMLYGEQEEVLADEKLWCCTTCHACQERCPHEITISGLLTHIMNLAAKRGNLPRPLKENIKLMAETGWSVKATSHSDRIREQLGLKPLKRPDTAEIRSILCEAGLEDILDL